MKRSSKIVMSLVSLSVLSYGGSKRTAIPEAVVIPIPPIVVLKQVNPIYIGLGALLGRYYHCGSDDCKYEDLTVGGLVRAGIDWNQYMGMEARVLATFLEEDELGGQLLRHGGLYLKPMLPFGEDTNLYGLVGYGWTKTYTGGNQKLATIDEGGLSVGLGIEYDFSTKDDDRDEDTEYEREFDGKGNQEKGISLFVDYQRLLVKQDIPDLDVVSTGITYDF